MPVRAVCQHDGMLVWPYAGRDICLWGRMPAGLYACMAICLGPYGRDVCLLHRIPDMPDACWSDVFFFFHGSLANLSDITTLYNFEEYDKKFIS